MKLTEKRNPENNFERLWRTFHRRYPFFGLRGVDWKRQYEIHRPRVTGQTTDKELFNILCEMLRPLNDGHVELRAKLAGERKKRLFCAETKPRFWREFTRREIRQLFKTTRITLVANGFRNLRKSEAWILQYCRSQTYGYIRILELEDVKKRCLTTALDTIAQDFRDLNGIIIDIRDNPGGDDSTVLAIINRFCDRKRVAFYRKTKTGPGDSDFTKLRTWHMEPQGDAQFTGPVVLLTCDSVFSGAEVFALAIGQLPHTTIMGEHTNGIFSYQLEKRLPNGWEYRLSHQMYFSADMICYEGKGVPPDIEIVNKKSDIENGVDPLIVSALIFLESTAANSVAVDMR
jgi:hypothetical protein